MPLTSSEHYYYLQGKWKDGSQLLYGGSGYNSGGIPCSFIFPGNTDSIGWGTSGIPQASWVQNSVEPGDVNSILSAGPFTFNPQHVINITLAFIYSRNPNSHDPLNIYKEPVKKITTWFNNGNLNLLCETTTHTKNLSNKNQLNIYPIPTNNILNIETHFDNKVFFEIIDISGKTVFSSCFQNKTTIDVSKLPQGIYNIRLLNSDKILSKRFVKL